MGVVQNQTWKIGGENAQMLLAVACFLEDRAVFVKMLGPVQEVRDERPRFVAFCESLKN